MPQLELSEREAEVIHALRLPRVKEVVIVVQGGEIITLKTTKSMTVTESEFEFITKAKELRHSHSMLFKRSGDKTIYCERSVKKNFIENRNRESE